MKKFKNKFITHKRFYVILFVSVCVVCASILLIYQYRSPDNTQLSPEIPETGADNGDGNTSTPPETPYIPVNDITAETSFTGKTGELLKLNVKTVPDNATYTSVIWSITGENETDAIIFNDNILIAKSPGTLKIRAEIINGKEIGVSFMKDFTAEITPGTEVHWGTSRDNGDGTFNNDAVLDTDTPDPRIIQHDGAFYMISTSMHFSPGLPVMKSLDLVNWEVVNYVYNILDDYSSLSMRGEVYDYGVGSWAPSLTYNVHDGYFYAHHTSNATGKTYFYKTKDIENGTWEQSINNNFYHDGGLLWDDDGTPYIFYGHGTIYAQQLSPDLLNNAGSRTAIITQEMLTEVLDAPSGGFLEATHAYKAGDTYYIFMCGWPPGRTKLQFVFKSDTVDSGYEGRLIIDDGMGRGEGASQGGMIFMPEGSETRYMGYFMHRRGAAGRGMVLTELTFDDDGWPVVTENNSLKISLEMNIPVAGTFERKSIVTSTDFTNGEKRHPYTYQEIYGQGTVDEPGPFRYNGSNLPLGFEWNHNPDNRYWSLTDRPGYLRLTNFHITNYGALTRARNVLTTRTFGPLSIGSIAMDISNMKNGDVAGLAAFNRNYAFCGVRMENNKKYIIYRYKVGDDNGGGADNYRKENNDPWKDVVLTALDDDITRVWIKQENVYRTFPNERDKVFFYYSIDGKEWIDSGQSRNVDFGWEMHFCGFRFGLFNFATEETGGYVDFDYFMLGDYPPY